MRLFNLIVVILLPLLSPLPAKAQMNPDDNLMVVCRVSAMRGWEAALETAEAELNRVLPAVIISMYDAGDQPCDLFLILSLASNVCPHAGIAIGCFDPSQPAIYVVNDPPNRTTILLHELAHALGIMWHPCHDGIKSILSCEYDPDQLSFTDWDMAYFSILGYPIRDKNFRD